MTSFPLLVSLLLSLASPPQAKADVATLAWLSGCWHVQRGAREIVEYWMRPSGGTLLGMSRTVANGRTVDYEFLMIRERDGAIEYVAKPSGQPEAVFPAVKVAADEVVFENPAHDFPQRISYRRPSPGALSARVEGTSKGSPRALDFPYTTAPCTPATPDR